MRAECALPSFRKLGHALQRKVHLRLLSPLILYKEEPHSIYPPSSYTLILKISKMKNQNREAAPFKEENCSWVLVKSQNSILLAWCCF